MAHGPATLADGWGKYISCWVFTTNHKDIGTLYLWFSFAMFIMGGAFAMIIRAELFQPGMQLIKPEFFNQMTMVIWLKNSGLISCIPGWKSSARIIIANAPPIINMAKLNHRYSVPISL